MYSEGALFRDLSCLQHAPRYPSPFQLEALLQRSGERKVNLSLKVPLQASDWTRSELVSTAARHMNRVTALSLELSVRIHGLTGNLAQRRWHEYWHERRNLATVTWRTSLPVLLQPARALERISLNSGFTDQGVGRNAELPVALFAGEAPHLRAIHLVSIGLPNQAYVALGGVEEFYHTPYPDAFGREQLSVIFQSFPALRVLELNVTEFIDEAGSDFSQAPVHNSHSRESRVPLCVLRINRVCQNLGSLVRQVDSMVVKTLEVIAIFEDSDMSTWFAGLQVVYPVQHRAFVSLNWMEIEVSTELDGQKKLLRVYIDDDPQYWNLRRMLRQGSLSSFDHLFHLTVHELLWPDEEIVDSDDSEASGDGPWPLLLRLRELEIIMATRDDHFRNFDETFGIFLSRHHFDARMPFLTSVAITHRDHEKWECCGWAHGCTCADTLAVALADIVDFIHRVTHHQSRPLDQVLLKGIDLVDVDIHFQLSRLADVASEVVFETMEVLFDSVAQTESYNRGPHDPRSSFDAFEVFRGQKFKLLRSFEA